MGIKFNADEMFEMAMRIEENGEKFYRRAAELFTDSTSKKTLSDLAGMEASHKDRFAKMRADLESKEKTRTAYDPDNATIDYLNAMADGYVFNVKDDPCATITGKEPVENVIRKAIGLEKDSIVFYLGLRDYVTKALGQDRVDDIIREEMGHINILSRELKKIAR